jgi:hypothetical protein
MKFGIHNSSWLDSPTRPTMPPNTTIDLPAASRYSAAARQRAR